MTTPSQYEKTDIIHGLKWLMLCRVIFSTILLGSTIIMQLREAASLMAFHLLVLYALIIGIFILSFVYSLWFKKINNFRRFAYLQVIGDTFIVSLIIFFTGGFSSIFSFLYLLVIIYAAILLFRKGSMITAALCGIQYGIMVDLEYYGILPALGPTGLLAHLHYEIGEVLYKVVITMVGCFAVAFLSSLLSERERKSKRELQIMEGQVKRVEKMAAIGEMAAGLAHEIKNPLASLTGSIQLLREELPPNPDQDKLMQIIFREADRLTSLLADFLMFAKPQIGNAKPIELAQVIDEAVTLFERDNTFRSHSVIEKDLIRDVWITMDPSHFQQVMFNLLLNAAESVETKGIIRVCMKLSKDQVELEITDNGCGISDEQMDSIFNPFYTTKPRGTGLGLSIVHSIIDAYGIGIHLESLPDEGTTVRLFFRQIEQPT